MALCRRVRALVARARVDWICLDVGTAYPLSGPARHRRSDLSSGRYQNCEPALSPVGPRAALWVLRLRNAHWTRAGRNPGSVVADPLRMATHIHDGRFLRVGLAHSVAVGNTHSIARRGSAQSR